MKTIMKIVLLNLILLLFTSVHAQFYEKSKYSGIGMPYFEVEVFRTFNIDSNSNRVYIWLQIINDDLTFVKKENGLFSAEIEINFAVFNTAEEQIKSKSQHHIVEEENFTATNARKEKQLIKEYFDLPPGQYEFRIQVNDLVSHKSMNRKINMNLVDLNSTSIELSDLLFLTKKDTSSIDEIIPRIRHNFPSREGDLYLHYYLYLNNSPDSVRFRYRMEDEKENIYLDTTMTRFVQSRLSDYFYRIDKKNLEKSKYSVVVEVELNGQIVERRKVLSFYWTTVPESEEDISLALRQMRYIIPSDSLDKYEDLSTEQQRKYFKQFWSKKDPNPATEENELMEEYFRRVNYAIREYSAFNQDGWLSDRGRILIKFGFPDDIERHPFEINSVPYEIWRYYSLRKVFVFSDRSGFGDYRLEPGYMDQEYH